MGDHEMIHAAAPAMYNISTASNGSAGNWWNTVVPPVSCSTDLAGFSSWSALAATCDMVDANKLRTTTTASSESPGSNSLSNNSSVTFQEPTSIADPAGIAVPPQSGFGEWSHPFLNISSSSLHGFLQDGHHDMSSRTDQNSMNKAALMNPSSNNLILQGHHEQDHGQLLSNLGSELLLSPTSPYGLQSSLLRSLMDPTPPAKPLPVFQQYQHQHQQTNQTPAARFAAAAASIREPLQFINETPFWNSSVGFATVATEGASLGVVKPSPAPRTTNLAMKTALEGVGDSSSIVTKKASAEPAFKKPRIEATSPLPTFKVRKEKLGDRITALQQLVSPFGKTDTASVLHETIDYIKFLHDQVGALSAPYLKNGHQVPHLKSSTDKTKDGELSLKGRGLCLVPISSTFAVASEVPVDFWAPFGATFR